MLWDIVFEFFVIHVFGGVLSDGSSYSATLGSVAYYYQGEYEDLTGIATSGFDIVPFLGDNGNYTYYMSLGNYLSLIATIISMVAIVLICCGLIKKIYNMCAHIIG